MEKHSLLASHSTNNSSGGEQFELLFKGFEWSFRKAFEDQKEKFNSVLEAPRNVYFLSGVHSEVYSLGNALKNKVSSETYFVQTDRGGQIMYHGPGQLTIYPIFKLRKYFSGPKEYINFLFQTCIVYFQESYGIKLIYKNNGLWILSGQASHNSDTSKSDQFITAYKKVGFIGLRIKNGVVYHGLSLNYNVDLSKFIKHSPCDISGDQAGNIVFSKEPNCRAVDRVTAPLDLKVESLELMSRFKRGFLSRD